MNVVAQNINSEVADKIVFKITEFLGSDELEKCIIIPKSELTHGCCDAYLSKRTLLMQLGICTEYKTEMKTIVFRARSNSEKYIVAFHIPATIKLPALKNGKFNFQALIEIINSHSESKKFTHLNYHPNLIHGCLNPIDLSINHKNIIHFFHVSYIEDPTVKYITTNAGMKNYGVVLNVQQIFKAFTKKNINYFIINF